jgi:hypothetical protein
VDNFGKKSSNKFEISALGKKGIVGKERMVLWCGGSQAWGYEDNFG